MASDQNTIDILELEEGEYPVTDPALLNKMKLTRDIVGNDPHSVLVTRYTPVTPALVEKLKLHGVRTLFAEPITETSVIACVEHMEKTFALIENVLNKESGNIDDVVENLRNTKQLRVLENLVRDNLLHVEDLFREDATEKLAALTAHHDPTVRHSLIAAFQLMAIGRQLGWNDTKIVIAAMGLVNHDVGKAKVKLETLTWPGRLNSEQWKEIQFHPLHGCRMLYQPGQPPDFVMLCALLHHEWYAEVEGKGYGGLTTNTDVVKQTMKFDCKAVVANMAEDVKDVFQVTCLADMVSALEESRAYKRGLDAFKVLIIMNSDAKMGHFKPAHYKAWHDVYMRQHPNLLPKGRRMALPREKERRIFTKLPPKAIRPTPLLTFYEMEKLGFTTVLANVGMDMERIQRRGGFSIKVLQQISDERGLNLDLSENHFKLCHIDPIKKEIICEQQVIELDAKREWLTVRELDRSGLMARAKSYQFDIDLIRQNGGISPERLERRGVPVNDEKLAKWGIKRKKHLPIQLPGSENRLTAEDLEKMGITDAVLRRTGCYARVKRIKSGVPLEWLLGKKIPITKPMLAQANVDPVRKIFYDIEVVEEISSTKAVFRIMREGDDPKELETLNETNSLGPIQDLLLNQIGAVEMDFSDLLALPDLSHVVEGKHWQGG